VLVTGAGGQVGHRLLQELADHEVVATDLSHFHPLDLRSPDAIRAFVREVRPELILHPAAYTGVDRAETEADAAREVNAEATRVLGEEARRLGIGIIHFSTDYV
jgi:dTDP-4-dehydrorhamnose reductase